MEIEKHISPFIESQFPSFYQEDGPEFIAFVKAYYEWLETENNIINQSRSLLEYRDIDTTLQKYVVYFKNKYINSLPENIISDKRLLTKHIIDLYRAKGTDASYKLLFRMIFNEDIDIFLPNKYIFKLSDGEWIAPKYLEVSDSKYLFNLIGTKIYSSSTGASGIVENYFSRTSGTKLINVLVLSNVFGNFKYGEKITSLEVPEITIDNAPIIFGSLSSISITNGGLGYNVGDLLDVNNSGVGALARVKSTKARNGEVTFELLKGGTGFSLDAVVNIDGRASRITNITNTNPIVVRTSSFHDLNDKQSIRIDFVKGMTEINTQLYSYFVQVINSTSFSIYNDINLSTSIDGTTYGPYTQNTGSVYASTGGSGATFKIGSLVNKEVFYINTDHVSDYLDTVIDDTVAGYDISVDNVDGTFSIGDIVQMNNVDVVPIDCTIITETLLANGESLSNPSLGISDLIITNTNDTYLEVKGSDIYNSNLVIGVTLVSNVSSTILVINSIFPVQTINATANVVFVNSSIVSVNSQNGYFLSGEKLYDITSSANADIGIVYRNTDWGGFAPLVAPYDKKNMDTPLSVLVYVNKEVGTIASLTDLNPGEGYTYDPVVSVIEPLIEELDIYEPYGSYAGTRKGFNAEILAHAGYATGIVTAVDIVDSGYGYDRDQVVELRNFTNPYAVTGTTVIDLQGKSQGYWLDNKSFISDNMYLQDSNYYQTYSYEIIASRMLNTYENYVKDLVHPVGMKLFGRYVIKNEFDINTSTAVHFEFSST